MKKVLCLLVALIMCLSLFACGSTETEDSGTPNSPINTPDEPPVTEHIPLDVELCAQYAIETLRNNLKNPDSLVITYLFGVETDDSYIIAIEYTAKNGFDETVADALFLDVLITTNGYATRTYGSGSFEEDTNQKYTAQICAKNKKRNGYYVFDSSTLLVSSFVESQVTAEIVEFNGKLKGKNDSYEGAWNVQIGDDSYLKVIYFEEGVDLSWYENFTGKPYEVTISALLEDGRYYDATIVADPVLDATHDERFARFNWYDREFYKTYVQTLTPMTEDEITAVLNDTTFTMRNNYGGDVDGTHTITFGADGRLDANYTYEGQIYSMYESWTVFDGAVVLYHSFTNTYGENTTSEYVFTPYQFDDSRYLLICSGSDFSMVLTIQ